MVAGRSSGGVGGRSALVVVTTRPYVALSSAYPEGRREPRCHGQGRQETLSGVKGTTGLIEEQAVAAYLAGRYDEGAQLWVRAFQERVTAGDDEAAAACAHWV